MTSKLSAATKWLSQRIVTKIIFTGTWQTTSLRLII